MPELPEVETIVRGLAPVITGKTIERAELRLARVVVAPAQPSFGDALAGDRITGVARRGKHAVMELASGRILVTSLRMTGRLTLGTAAEPEMPSTHVVLRLAGGHNVRFSDVRTLGRMRLVPAGVAWDRDLGIEPLSSDFTHRAFMGMLAGRTTPIKVLLLDQRRVAGIGNIYACEALWEARIRPSRPARALTQPEIRRLRRAIIDVLQRAITMRGSSIDDYVDAAGLQGGFQNNLSVYGRDGQRCRRCGTGRVIRTVLAQRGTWSCRRCQR